MTHEASKEWMPYRKTCAQINFDAKTFILSAECKTDKGSTRQTSIDLSKCVTTTTGDSPVVIPNNGQLTTKPLTRWATIADARVEDDGRFLKLRAQYSTEETGIAAWFHSFGKKPWEKRQKVTWKDSQLDLDAHLRNQNGQLEFCAPYPPQALDWIPKSVKDALDDKTAQFFRKKVLDAGVTKETSEAHQAGQQFAGVDDLLKDLKKQDTKWWAGTFKQAGMLCRPGT